VWLALYTGLCWDGLRQNISVAGSRYRGSMLIMRAFVIEGGLVHREGILILDMSCDDSHRLQVEVKK
jgi:hypothetical protein